VELMTSLDQKRAKSRLRRERKIEISGVPSTKQWLSYSASPPERKGRKLRGRAIADDFTAKGFFVRLKVTHAMTPSPIITLVTDFGTADPFVGIMKGVMYGINPAARIVDLSHGVPPQDVFRGALILRAAVPYFPSGTIHVGVVDPGVGTGRRALLIDAEDGFFIGPDNGVLSLALIARKINRITELNDDKYFLKPKSQTFHGRDIFAPVAAHLSLRLSSDGLGSTADDFTKIAWPPVARSDGRLEGEIIYIDSFGNLITNIEERDVRSLAPSKTTVSLLDFELHGLQSSYSSGAGQELVALINSWGLLEIAKFCGSAYLHSGAKVGERVLVAGDG
jgi:S-adenosylmethionine hydrolase